jgi:uncharacterized phage protein gp47/JayE
VSYKLLTYDEILEAILIDYENQLPGADTSQGSDIYIKATAFASALWGQYQHQAYILRQIFPDLADTENLERHAATYGIYRKPASKASGKITFTGQDGTVIPAGTQAGAFDGLVVVTTAEGIISDGSVTIAAQAIQSGVSGSLTLGQSLTVQNPPPGVGSAATVADDGNGNGFTGGADVESDSSLLARLLDRIQYPPAGGNEHDYQRWALEIPGITEAYVFPLRQGMGSITVVVLTSGTGAARIPGQTLLDSVKVHIDELRPVCDQFLQVLAPTSLATDVEVQVKAKTGNAFAAIKPWVESAINGLLGEMDPLETLYISKLQAVVADVEGVLDSVIVMPAANIQAQDLGGVTIQMVTPGVITVAEMV